MSDIDSSRKTSSNRGVERQRFVESDFGDSGQSASYETYNKDKALKVTCPVKVGHGGAL